MRNFFSPLSFLLRQHQNVIAEKSIRHDRAPSSTVTQSGTSEEEGNAKRRLRIGEGKDLRDGRKEGGVSVEDKTCVMGGRKGVYQNRIRPA